MYFVHIVPLQASYQEFEQANFVTNLRLIAAKDFFLGLRKLEN